MDFQTIRFQAISLPTKALSMQIAHAIQAVKQAAGHLLDQTVSASKAVSESLSELPAELQNVSYSSVLVEYMVPQRNRWAFRRWCTKFIGSAKRAEGFLRADRPRPLPCQNGVFKWYSVIHFDRPARLNQWLASEERHALLQEGQHIFETYRFKSFATGSEGWFSQRQGIELGSLAPPAWKQILTVVLGLYPIILTQEYLFDYLEVWEDWSPASAMMANLLITSCILTFVVMPLIDKALKFWLRPAHKAPSAQAEIVGTVSILTIMGLMTVVFNAIA